MRLSVNHGCTTFICLCASLSLSLYRLWRLRTHNVWAHHPLIISLFFSELSGHGISDAGYTVYSLASQTKPPLGKKKKKSEIRTHWLRIAGWMNRTEHRQHIGASINEHSHLIAVNAVVGVRYGILDGDANRARHLHDRKALQLSLFFSFFPLSFFVLLFCFFQPFFLFCSFSFPHCFSSCLHVLLSISPLTPTLSAYLCSQTLVEHVSSTLRVRNSTRLRPWFQAPGHAPARPSWRHS